MATVGRTEKNDEDASPTCAQSGTPTPRPRAKCALHTPTAGKAYSDKTLRVLTPDPELRIHAGYWTTEKNSNEKCFPSSAHAEITNGRMYPGTPHTQTLCCAQ